MGQVLYRKYRPKSLTEVIGQEHITETLEQAISSGRISHAYLLTGPKGVGKTSIARIIAHEINKLPYKDDYLHLDIIEIDAASNRRIDEIRELREKVYITPTSAKYKVYIIDEVHMLTPEAFNALLKTLEEPPDHAVFILATTEVHKLPATIISRTQHFRFKPVDRDKVATHLNQIAKQEGIQISKDALELISEHGEGSFRDSISIMDQVSNDNKIVTLKDVQKLLGLPPVTSLNEIIISLTSENNELLQILESLYVQGYQAAIIAKQLADRLRKDLLGDSKYLNPSIALRLMSKLIEVPVSHDPEHYLEIILLETIFASKSVKQSNQLITNEMNAKTELAPPVKTVLSSTIEQKITKTEEKSSTQSSLSSGQANPLDLSIWPQVLTALKKKHNTVYSIARMGQPTFSETGHLILVFAFAFHQKRINDVKNRQLLTDTIREITGKNIPIECVFDNQLAKKPTTKSITTMPQNIIDPSLKTISNIFGGGELLES